jgi:hypothetical protein
MARTFRSSKTWVWFVVLLPLGCLICAPFVVAGPFLLVHAVLGESHDTPKWFDLLFATAFMFFSFGAARWAYKAFDVCHEFTLEDNGWCEFRSLRRRRRLHSAEVVSIEFDEGMVGLRYRGGTLALLETDDFGAFVGRLKQLNPSVDVDGPERWATA